jgi:hypothetical protein
MTVDDDRPGTKPTPGPVPIELSTAAAVLGACRAALASAPLTSPPGRDRMLRLASALGDLLAVLADAGDDGDELDGLEPYCTGCGSWIGMFHGLEGWHHFRGKGTAASPVELYDAGHEAIPGWLEPPGRRLSPADVDVVRQALADASAWRTWRTGSDHAADVGQAAAYEQLLRRLVTGDAR